MPVSAWRRSLSLPPSTPLGYREVDEGCACQADSPAGTWPGKKSQKPCLLARESAAPRGRQLGVGKHAGHLATAAVWQVSGVCVVF